jgi:Rieske Fe-S protein
MSDERVESETGATTRRALLVGAGAAGAAAVLAACGTDEGGRDPSSAPNDTDPDANGSDPGGGTDPGEGEQGEDGGEVLATTDEVEVGGGLIVADQSVVITQPTEGTFLGFSAACTHEGCIVASVSDGTINCTCHGSRFSIQDGSVVNGPATRPLPTMEINVDGDQITFA